jgi:bifunctional UDP-N-acetylglucosamine pyrophosphorylase/glucosamine-1-phosphate N-acetyltransferase
MPVPGLSIRLLSIKNGVKFIDAGSVYIGPDVIIGAGTVVYPNNYIEGATVIGENCELGPNNRFRDAVVGDGCDVQFAVIAESRLGNGVKAGPFVNVRPGSVIADNVKIGDFVEVKNSTIGDGAKLPHLTYVGDADVGSGVNFGCGSVVVNYDGKRKYRTTVGDNVFIGCNTNLIAPVNVGEGSYTAAGSTITDDVPPGALAIARARQMVKGNWTLP